MRSQPRIKVKFSELKVKRNEKELNIRYKLLSYSLCRVCGLEINMQKRLCLGGGIRNGLFASKYFYGISLIINFCQSQARE